MVRTVSQSGKERAAWRASDEFDKMVAAFGKEKIKHFHAVWVDGTNLEQFNRGIAAGKNPRDAAAATWSGNQALKLGLTRITPLNPDATTTNQGPFNGAEIIFSRPTPP